MQKLLNREVKNSEGTENGSLGLSLLGETKIARGVAETRLTVEKMLKGHNSGKNQLSMTSIKYHFLVMGTITGKFHQNPLKTVGGVAETRLCLRTD